MRITRLRTTRNPARLDEGSAGGSSGGAGAALASGACRRPPTAATTGGSLRNPENFNGIVAFRPSAGLAPALLATDWLGPQRQRPDGAKCVEDLNFLSA
jgi:Asp-tRNA(Asn)/Glu-tRNA(Gln) amidotransferase A subunit family amidase